MKRMLTLAVIVLIVAASMSLAVAAPKNFNPEGFPIVDKPITLKMFARRAPVNLPFDQVPALTHYEKMTNIHIDWEDVPTEGFPERRNLVFASNKLPDAFFRAAIPPLDAVKYGSVGMLIPLEDLIEKYAPNLTALMEEYPEIRQGATAPDGHIYTIPGLVILDSARTEKHWINKSWLDKLGLDIPETIDEFAEVLRAFKANADDLVRNGRDLIPFTARHFDQLRNQTIGIFGLQNQMAYNLEVVDDKVNIWYTDDRYKETLMWLHDLYAEGLLDRDVFTHTETEYVGKMGSGNVGFFYDQTNNPFIRVKDQYVGIGQFVGPHGDSLKAATPIARDPGAFAITYANKHPEATIRWIDYFYGDEGSILFRFGPEGETMYFDEDGNPQYADWILNDPEGRGNNLASMFGGGAAPHVITERNAGLINPPQVQEAQKPFIGSMPERSLTHPLFDNETNKRVNTIRQDLDAYVTESSVKFIAGELSFDQWDNYVRTVEKMGLEELNRIYQDAYDRVYKE